MYGGSKISDAKWYHSKNMSKLVQIQYDTNCYDSIWFELLRFIWFSNMSKLVQIQYDMNCYDSIRYELLRFIWFSNMSKLAQIQYDMNCYDSCDSQTCLNMLKHVWTCSDSIW